MSPDCDTCNHLLTKEQEAEYSAQRKHVVTAHDNAENCW
jgi:hypothetical protein